jgi:hypothetical protein
LSSFIRTSAILIQFIERARFLGILLAGSATLLRYGRCSTCCGVENFAICAQHFNLDSPDEAAI